MKNIRNPKIVKIMGLTTFDFTKYRDVLIEAAVKVRTLKKFLPSCCAPCGAQEGRNFYSVQKVELLAA